MRARWSLRTGCHFERPQVARDQDLQLLHVLLLRLHHAEDQTVSLPHALGVGRFYVLLHNLLPAPTAQPAAKETLHLLNLPQLHRFLYLVTEASHRLGGRLKVHLTAETASAHRCWTDGRATLSAKGANFCTQLFNFRSQVFALLGVLPFCCLLALHHLQQVHMFLFQFFLLQKHFVEAERRRGLGT